MGNYISIDVGKKDLYIKLFPFHFYGFYTSDVIRINIGILSIVFGFVIESNWKVF